MSNIIVTGLTAAKMAIIEGASVVGGVVTNGRLILTKKNGQTIDAGSVIGPKGDVGPPGSITASPAGGDLTGNYPNPTVAQERLTFLNFQVNHRDGTPSTPGVRSLGTGATQAAAGNHNHGDTGWQDLPAANRAAGDAPFASAAVDYVQYRKRGQIVHIRFSKPSTASIDRSGNTSGNFPNVSVVTNLPVGCRPSTYPVIGQGRMADSPCTIALNQNGAIVWTGGSPRLYASGLVMSGDFMFFTDN